jgi:SAM-dependent methyltransferase
VKSPAELVRQAQFVLASAEFLLGRAVRSVLDVGCGEGQWRAALRRHRPRLAYTGVDPSAYAIARYGARRHLFLGSIDSLDQLPLEAGYDLVICCGMLNYLQAPVLQQGLRQVAARTGGMAYLELFTREDHFEGDTNWPEPKAAAWYRQQMTRAGFFSLGMQCYITDRSRDRVSALEVNA